MYSISLLRRTTEHMAYIMYTVTAHNSLADRAERHYLCIHVFLNSHAKGNHANRDNILPFLPILQKFGQMD